MRAKLVRRFALAFGAVPLLGWLASLAYNQWRFGSAFTTSGEWNNFPLWIVTLPFAKIAGVLSEKSRLFQDYPYLLVLVHTALCTALYLCIGLFLGLLVQGVISVYRRAQSPRLAQPGLSKR